MVSSQLKKITGSDSDSEGPICQPPTLASSVMERTPYDIAIIGSGIACSLTLCQLAERLKDAPLKSKKLRIGIIEKQGEFWNGIPYGRRSIVGALAFQKLQDFLDEPERTSYIDWLVANKHWWLKSLQEAGGPGAAKWIADNRFYMERGKWEELYLPRFLFGIYVSSCTANALDELSNNGLATVTPILGEATGISRGSGGFYTVAVEDDHGTGISVNAERVVLAIGSPPQRSVHTGAVASQQSHTHIDDLYSPSEEINIQRIHHALSSLPDKRMANILILGSNASSLEVLYLINYRAEIRKLINSVVVLSRSGLLPYKICEETVQFEFTALKSLLQSGSFSADDLFAAITFDIQRAQELKLNIADLRNAVGALVSRLIGLMDIKEQETFICQHGFYFSKMMRRAGRDTRDAADELASLGILTMVKGQLHGFEPSQCGNGLVSATYADPECQGALTHPVPFSVTINCGGFEELDVCSSPLINSVIDNGLCQVNSTNRGFLVNDRLEASENLYVIGPLVAGNFNSTVRFWHVENAARIVGLSKLLAESLAHSLSPPSEYNFLDTNTSASVMASGVYPPYF